MEQVDSDLGDESAPYARYVSKLSDSYPELKPLSHFLTGKYPPSTECLTWSTSSNVDVIIVDIKSLPGKPDIVHIRDIDLLKQSVATPIPTDIALRLYLVEDVSADVVNVLGTMRGVYPHMFENHMHTMGVRKSVRIDENGIPLAEEKSNDLLWHSDKAESESEIVAKPYFSLPFYRRAKYQDPHCRRIHEKRRTMFREYFWEYSVLEERVTGAIQSVEDGGTGTGILLFDSIGSLKPFEYSDFMTCRGFFDPLPSYSTYTGVSPSTNDPLDSLRDTFVGQFQLSELADAILEDQSAILWVLMKSIVEAWLLLSQRINLYTDVFASEIYKAGDNRDILFAIDTHRLLQDSLAMLKHYLIIAKAGGCATLKSKADTRANRMAHDLKTDFQDLVKQMEFHMNQNQQRITTLAAMRSIIESGKVINQSDKIGALTTLATFYIPLSFVSSFLGMNVIELSSQKTSIWMFFAISCPIMLLTLGASRNWETLREWWRYLFREDKVLFDTDRRTRWKALYERPWDALREAFRHMVNLKKREGSVRTSRTSNFPLSSTSTGV